MDLNDLVNSFKKMGIEEEDLNLNLSKLTVNSKIVEPLFSIPFHDFLKINKGRYLSPLEVETVITFVKIDFLIKRYPFLSDSDITDIEKNIDFFLYGDFLIYGDFPDALERVYQYSKDIHNDTERIFWLHIFVTFVTSNNIYLDDYILNNIVENIRYFRQFPSTHSFYKEANVLNKLIKV